MKPNSPLPKSPQAKLPLSVTLITLNEEKNISRSIQSVLSFASEIIVVDSGSKDQTCAIAQSLGAKVFHQDWLGFGQQKNKAMSYCNYDWVLNLDADEEVSADLRQELCLFFENQTLLQKYSAMSFPRLSQYLGKWIKHGGWYPNRLTRLSKKSESKWSEPAVHEALQVNGRIGQFKSDLLHYPFKGIQDQIHTNLKFSYLGYLQLQKRQKNFSILKALFKPIGKFIETYFLKQGFRDGFVGFLISIHAAHSIFMKYTYYLEGESLNNENPRN